MAKIYEFEGVKPVIDPSAFVHPDAVIIGDVSIGAKCYIGPCASLRGDFGKVIVGNGANVQDCCVLHSIPGQKVVLEENAHIGHGAILHGCTIRQNAMIGVNAVVMDNAVIGKNTFVAALAFVKAGFEAPDNVLVTGIPAKVTRSLSEDEIAIKGMGTEMYQQLAERSMKSIKPVSG